MIKKKSFFNDKVKLFSLKRYRDERGYFLEFFSKKNLSRLGIKDNFVQDNISYSAKKSTIRGLHFQKKPYAQSKILHVISGSIQDIVVDLRKESKFFKKHISVELSSKNFELLYIPEGFAHGFCTLESKTLVLYKISNFYNKRSEVTIKYNDNKLNIKWKYKKNQEILSKKDMKGLELKNLNYYFNV